MKNRPSQTPQPPLTDSEELPLWPHRVQGGKYVKQLQKYVQSLRAEDAANTHGNRALFLDDVFIAQLLAFFNPTVRTLRTIEDFSQTKQAQKHLTTRKICKSTLSDFNALADPKRLQPLIAFLRQVTLAQRENGQQRSEPLNQLLEQTIAVDGTFLPALANVAWAVRNTNQHGSQNHRARIDVMLNVEDGLPEAIVVPEPHQGEAESARHALQPGKLYLYDRGFNSLPLIAAHYQEGDTSQVLSQFVLRLRGDGKKNGGITFTSCEERALSDEDRAAGVVEDRFVRLSSTNAARLGLSDVELREVVIDYEQDGELKQLQLLTNLLDVPAEIIGQLYRHRWQVELFFRWLKSYGNFRHLISQTKPGMELHFYVAMIGIMLMYLHTGYRPSKYMFPLLGMVANGSTTLEEIMPILRERERRCALARESQRRRNAKKKALQTQPKP
jgi:hypothetical protein